MKAEINVPTIIHYRKHDGASTFQSYLPSVPRGMHLQKVCDMLTALLAIGGRMLLRRSGGREGPRPRIKIMRDHLKPDQRVFVGVINPIDPRIETSEEVRDRVLEAAEYIPIAQLGTCDDCGFSPFCDDTSTTRETAFAKIRARVEGTALASERMKGK